MNPLLLNNKNSRELELYKQKLPQALILSVPDYEWGSHISEYLASENNYWHEYIYPTKKEEIDLEHGQITVDQIRGLINKVSKHSKKGEVHTLYMADTMQAQAQNAFLKVLEEPNANTFFILLVKNKQSLLPTVISRSRTFNIMPLNNHEAANLIPPKIDQKTKQQILFASKGNPVAISSMINDGKIIESFSNQVSQAKQLITSTPYQKIILFNKLKDDRLGAINLIESLIQILSVSARGDQASKLLQLLNNATLAHRDLKANYNVRLALIKHLL